MSEPIDKEKIIGQTIAEIIFDKANPFDISGESTIKGFVLSNGLVVQVKGFQLWNDHVAAIKILP
jgi:hypothetical protein